MFIAFYVNLIELEDYPLIIGSDYFYRHRLSIVNINLIV